MIILPAIDLYNGKCVRLLKGDYDKMTIYNENPEEVAMEFEGAGARHIHIVDLEGAKNGSTPNIDTIKRIVSSTTLSAEIGGGIRSFDVIEAYLDCGVKRVILGTAAVENKAFLIEAVKKYGDKIAVGADIRNGYVAVKGWTENSDYKYTDYFDVLENIGVKTVICTDISRDGVMKGTNVELYRSLKERYNMNIIASGGVSDISDIKSLMEVDVYGAIIGKAYYTGAIDLKQAVSISNATEADSV